MELELVRARARVRMRVRKEESRVVDRWMKRGCPRGGEEG